MSILCRMQADPQRQWFVYFNEKEMGPFTEVDVKKKLTAGELTNAAYLFTEGMPDWALVEDVSLFKTPIASPPAADAEFSVPQNEFTNSSVGNKREQTRTSAAVRTGADPTMRGVQVDSKVPTQAVVADAVPSTVRKKVVTALLLLLVVALGYLIYLDKKNNPEIADIEKELNAKPVAKTVVPVAAPASDVNWKDLQTLRESNDTNVQPFQIASGNLGGEKPIVVGVLSQMIKADKVYAAVFSDNEKSLSAVPKIWFLEVPVLDGYFTLGPFSTEGKALTNGTYHVIVAANGNFLGKVAFTQGAWPSEAEVAEMQKKIQNERTLLADKEMASLNEKLQEMVAAYNQLEVIGRVAALGPRKLQDWKTKSQPWRKILNGALEDQRSVLAGPMFYGEAQTQLYAFMSSLMKHYEALDINAKEGPVFLQRVKGKGLGQLWSQLKLDKDKLAGEIQAALKNPPGALKIDPEVVKNRITEMSK